MQDKNKNKLLDKLAATSWGVRAGPPKKKHYGESWRAHPKKNKKILVKVAVQVKTT
tara:strand:+ start:23 stop:190 length:168 start_codon:yes stop_codon:yes gene_type:complete